MGACCNQAANKHCFKRDLVFILLGANAQRRMEPIVSKIESICKDNDIDRISLSATDSGAYVWAALGFDIDPREPYADDSHLFRTSENFKKETIFSIFDRFKYNIEQSKQLSTTDKTEAVKLIRSKQRSGEIKSMNDFTKLPLFRKENGEAISLAKVYLRSIDWNGIKLL